MAVKPSTRIVFSRFGMEMLAAHGGCKADIKAIGWYRKVANTIFTRYQDVNIVLIANKSSSSQVRYGLDLAKDEARYVPSSGGRWGKSARTYVG